jgi:hypothetical protein
MRRKLDDTASTAPCDSSALSQGGGAIMSGFPKDFAHGIGGADPSGRKVPASGLAYRARCGAGPAKGLVHVRHAFAAGWKPEHLRWLDARCEVYPKRRDC